MPRLLICLTVVTIFFQLYCALPDGERRVKRHADGLFSSQYSQYRNDKAMKHNIRTQLDAEPKRSVSQVNYSNGSEENEARLEGACFNWLYQGFRSKSLSDDDALEAAQECYKLICRPTGHPVVSLVE